MTLAQFDVTFDNIDANGGLQSSAYGSNNFIDPGYTNAVVSRWMIIHTPNDGKAHNYSIDMTHLLIMNGTWYGGVHNSCHTIACRINTEDAFGTNQVDLEVVTVDTSGCYYPAPCGLTASISQIMSLPPDTYVRFSFPHWILYPSDAPPMEGIVVVDLQTMPDPLSVCVNILETN